MFDRFTILWGKKLDPKYTIYDRRLPDKTQNSRTLTMTINENSLYLLSGCICCFSGLYTDTADLIGVDVKGECVCIEEEICFKLNRLNKESLILCSPCVVPNPDGLMCRLGLGCVGIGLKKPVTCIKNRGQCFCCYGAAALPTDSEVPVTCAICFLSLYPKVGCFKKLGEMK